MHSPIFFHKPHIIPLNTSFLKVALRRCTVMHLYEYKAKELFAKYGIPTQKGAVVSSPGDVPGDLQYPVVVKAQVLTGGRGKAGGVKFASCPDEAKTACSQILGMSIKGHTVRQVLIVPKIEITRELYLGLIIDRKKRVPLLIASGQGGINIEDIPDDKLFRRYINPFTGLRPYVIRELSAHYGLTKEQGEMLRDMALRLYDLFVKEDSEFVEINPLAVTSGGKLVAADAKCTIDDDALFRHPEYKNLEQELPPLEKKAREKDIAFVQLDGNIGVIANGAGLTMATLDYLNYHGGKAGVFLDLGGTDSPEKVKEAFSLMVDAKPSVILMNIFGGITRCDTVARGVREFVEENNIKLPMVVRIKGVKEEEARKILQEVGISAVLTMDDVASTAIRLEKDARTGAGTHAAAGKKPGGDRDSSRRR
jgi:succinyl-CoA synthetase beta subunit